MYYFKIAKSLAVPTLVVWLALAVTCALLRAPRGIMILTELLLAMYIILILALGSIRSLLQSARNVEGSIGDQIHSHTKKDGQT